MSIKWEENLRIGLPEFDEQHEEFFVYFSRLAEALEEGGGSEEVAEILPYLDTYATTHLSDEENLMVKYKCAGLEEQQQQHALFKENIARFSEQLATTEPTREIAIKINATLIRYFINHVRKLDVKMVEYIKPMMG